MIKTTTYSVSKNWSDQLHTLRIFLVIAMLFDAHRESAATVSSVTFPTTTFQRSVPANLNGTLHGTRPQIR